MSADRITRPGKFESQMAYMEPAYEAFLDGGFDETADGVIIVDIAWEGRRRTVRFVIDDMGFVREV